jgi:hypothetical protein
VLGLAVAQLVEAQCIQGIYYFNRQVVKWQTFHITLLAC